ncbi:MAG: sugar phosphate isomerase/epimerase family protein [Bryobacteraceae bacterium]|nr:sugar phosphate isomerase/epimerase family protein [Bryobacteraceae bacterium]
MINLTRRELLATALASPAFAASKVPIGLELYSVRDELKADLRGTVTKVAKMGYQGVEFYSPYFDWTVAQAKETRQLLDDLGIKCLSTHNSAKTFAPENLGHATELNQILGSKLIVMASAGKIADLDGWKGVAERLSAASEKLKPAGMRSGFHNHKLEFDAIGGTKPMEVLAKNTPKDVVLQLDIGTCLHSGTDPVAWIKANPGRIRSIHLKDWGPEKGYRVLLGEGAAKWKEIFAAAEKSGGVEAYLVEQEGGDLPPFETVERCLANFKKLRS